ncbi:MAG: hypothetical protein JWN41_1557 [Thermoleophilia bacterium]|nr:hypothetical protein [Thermoleophilia bacterium]
MTSPADLHAGMVAAAAGVLATTVVAWFGIRAWQSWRSFRRTKFAADALLDAHRDHLDATVVTAASSVARVGGHGGELADALVELHESQKHLTWMLRKVPDERDRLRRELLDIVLPTAASERERVRD